MCLAETGKPPIGTRWIDIDKGDNSNLHVRSIFGAARNEEARRPRAVQRNATERVHQVLDVLLCFISVG